MSAPETPAADARLRGDIQWADEVFGRAGGLTAAGVFAAAGTATQLVGFAVGDPKLHLKAGLRGLIPLHLRVSARVHHVSFLHPSLDTEFAHLAGGRDGGYEGGASASNSKKGSPNKDKKGYVKNLDMNYLCGSEYATVGGRDGGFKGGGGSNSLEALVLDEKRRLSRDGIVRDHADRKRRAARRGSKAKKKPSALPQIKGKRTFVMLGADDAGGGKSKKDIPSPGDVKMAVAAMSSSKQKEPKSTFRRGHSFQDGTESRTPSQPPSECNRPVVFDEEGITGDGPLLASVIMESPAAKIGRYLPETACRVPQCAVGFELVNDASRVKSTQPFVAEAPHIIWGGARDAPLKMVANDGNALVEARDLEYLTDTELDLAERTESLLVIGSTVWVDIPPEVKKDAKTSKDYAKIINKKMEKAAKKGGKHVKKGLTVTADVTKKGATATADFTKKGATATADFTKKGATAIGKAATDATKTGAKGMADFGEKVGKATKKGNTKANSAEKSSIADAESESEQGESVDEFSQGTFDNESLEQVDVHEEYKVDVHEENKVDVHEEGTMAGKVSSRGSKKGKKLKKMFKKTAKAMHLTKKKDKVTIGSDAELESVHTGADDGADRDGLNASTERGMESTASDTDEEESTELAGGDVFDDSALLPKKSPHYSLVLDDVLQLRITGFPFSGCLATFPVSVAAILSATSMEDRIRDPRRPSEITVTLVQEPSITEGRWGVEMRVTFRAVEVRPDSALAVEENPALDEKTGKWRKVKFADKMKKFKILLKNAGKSKEEIQAEIKAAEAKEEEEQQAREAAIVRAGIGRGYEQGAATRDIVKRQMFYDPERVANRRVKRRSSSNVDKEIIKAMAITGHGFETELLGRRGGAVSPLLPGTDQVSDMQVNRGNTITPRNVMGAIIPNSDTPVDFPSSTDGFRLQSPEISELTLNKHSVATAKKSGFTSLAVRKTKQTTADESSADMSIYGSARISLEDESAEQGSADQSTWTDCKSQLREESTTYERTGQHGSESASQVTTTGFSRSEPRPPKSLEEKQSASETMLEASSQLPPADQRSHISLHPMSVESESPDQASSFVTARLASSFENKQLANETNLESTARLQPTVKSSDVLQHSVSKSESPEPASSLVTAKSARSFDSKQSLSEANLESTRHQPFVSVQSESLVQSSSFVTAKSAVYIDNAQSSSEANPESTGRILPTGKSSDSLSPPIPVSESSDQPSSFVTARSAPENASSASFHLATALDEGAQRVAGAGSQSQENGEGIAGESKQTVTESSDGAQLYNSAKVAGDAERVPEISPQLDRRKLMLQAHRVSGSGHKAESLNLSCVESRGGTSEDVGSVSQQLVTAFEEGVIGSSVDGSQSRKDKNDTEESKQTVTESNDGAQVLNSAQVAAEDAELVSEISPQHDSHNMMVHSHRASGTNNKAESLNLGRVESRRGESRDASSVSQQLVTALDEGAQGSSVGGSRSRKDDEGDTGESKRNVTESNDGSHALGLAQVAAGDAELVSEISPRLDRRKMMLQSHNLSRSGHKAESLHQDDVESRREIIQGSQSGIASKTEAISSFKSIGSGKFEEIEAGESLSEQRESKIPQSMIKDGALLDSIREVSESSEKSSSHNGDQGNGNPLNVAGSSVADSTSPDDDLQFSVGSKERDRSSVDESGSKDRSRTSVASNMADSPASASHLISSLRSGSNVSMDRMEPKTSAQLLRTSSDKDEGLRLTRSGMMSQSQGVSGGKLSLAQSISKADSSKPVRSDTEDFDAFLQRLRREKLQEDYHKEKEARLSLAARSVTSSSRPPMSFIFLRMSAIRNNSAVTGASTASSVIPGSASGMMFDSSGKSEERKEDGVRDISWYCSRYIEPFGTLLKAIFLDEYPGLLVLIIIVGAIILIAR